MFILYGETGEYDDYKVWVVGIFKYHNKAISYMKALEANANSLGVPLDISAAFYGNCPQSLEDEGLRNNWVGYGVEYSVGKISVLDDSV
jgi:hypothetical protein